MQLMLLALAATIATMGSAVLFLVPWLQEPLKLEDKYWGPGKAPRKIDTTVRPFKVQFSDEMVSDLKMRLRMTREMVPPLENTGWTYGVSGSYVPTIVDYWLHKYDFKKREAHLNQYPQFVTNIQGLDIHFIHVKPQLPKNSKLKILPLYIQHGWPGSVVELQKVIPLLTTPQSDKDFVFEVIAPSLPGFGFSDVAAKPGLGAVEITHLMKNLMLRLGFEKFYIQGGDWGAVIVANMASMYPQHVLGVHSNMCFVMKPWTWIKMAAYSLVPSLFPEDEQKLMFPVTNVLSYLIESSGYLHLQATKPDTLGVGVSDSPAGLASYILEKFSGITNAENQFSDDGNLLEKFTMDELLDNIMMYWVPNKATTSFRIYAETFNKRGYVYDMENVLITVPSACAQFPKEMIFQSEVFLRDRFVNLIHVTKMPRGGHFAAMEEPKLLADDIWTAIQTMRNLGKRKKAKTYNEV